MSRAYFYLIFLSFAAVSCVSAGKYKSLQKQSEKTDSLYAWSEQTLKTCQETNLDLNKQKTNLQNQLKSQGLELNASKENITTLRKQVQTLSALSSAQAESLKQSIDNIGAKDSFIQDLHSAVAHRDSLNMVALMNLKAYMGGFGDSIVMIKVEKGTVSVDIADSLLFTDSSSYLFTPKARSVIGRLARVLNDVPDVGFTVEARAYFADSLAVAQDSLPDVWDLSVKRATAIVRMLQDNYHIAPARMTAAGNTRDPLPFTRITITPEMDRVLTVLERR
jgi:chemotaxis protein MotB